MAIAAEIVFCDDIRVEDNGKFILIGVYGAELVPGRMPHQFPLAVWIKARGVPRGQSKFRFELVMPGGNVTSIVEGVGSLEDDSRPVIMIFPNLHCDVQEYGDLVCRLGLDGAEPQEIGRLPIVPPPTASG